MYESYGVLSRANANSLIDKAVEEIRLLGFSSINSGYSPDEISNIKAESEEISLKYKQKYQNFDLVGTGESNNHRAPLLENSIFLEIAQNENVLQIVSKLIVGDFFLNQQNLVVNPPNSENYNQLKFHRDLPYQHYVISRPIAINALLAVDNFTVQNGATVVIPASHKQEEFSSDPVIESQSKQIEVKAGTFLLLDCMTYHAAGANRSLANRIGVNHVYSSVMLRPQIDWSRAVPTELLSRLNPSQKTLLGLRHKIAGSVEEFLDNRMNRL